MRRVRGASSSLFRTAAVSVPAASASRQRSAPLSLLLSRRRLCSAATEARVRLNNAYFMLGLEPGATRKQVKLAYYRLAKETHPDVIGGGAARKANRAAATGAVNRAVVRDEQTGFLDEEGEAASPASFLEVQAAFDAVIDALDHPEGTEGEEGGKRKRRPDRREKTLGELLVERLGEEPETVAEVWDEIREQNLEVTAAMLTQLLHACTSLGSDGFHTAVDIIEAEECTFQLGARQSGLCSLLQLCTGPMGEDEAWDADVVVNYHINDEDREHPNVIAAIGAVYCAGTRSPF
mmetsp:Transcript_43150/g.136181  ORF Transcript_43150/g.136181 Transcript_43150/m.136181 type:complete len:293 (-) Transcript_43150:167-1045(-)